MAVYLGRLFTSIIAIAVNHIANCLLDATIFAVIVQRTLQSTPWILSGDDAFVASLAEGIARLDNCSQTKIVRSLCKSSPDESVVHLIHPAFVQSLSPMSEDIFVERIKKFDVDLLRGLMTLATLSQFSDTSRRVISYRLLTVMFKLSEDMKLAVEQNLVNTDSDDGF